MSDWQEIDMCGIYLLDGDEMELDEFNDIKSQFGDAVQDLANSYDMG